MYGNGVATGLMENIIATAHLPIPRDPVMATIVRCVAAVGAVLRKVAVFRAATKIRPMSGRAIVGCGWFWLKREIQDNFSITG